MAILPSYEYDIFISYRHNDNRSGWVTEFVNALQEELAATIKEPISVYFDTNPHDGLHENHEVDDSLKHKLKSLILIPIVSRTYCDTNSFAWNHEFKAFIDLAKNDSIGSKIKVSGGNVANRVLPIRIHELKSEDINLFESEMEGKMRSIDFIYKESGVNRPLQLTDNRNDNQTKTDYRNQINKVANAIDEVITGVRNGGNVNKDKTGNSSKVEQAKPFSKELKRRNVIRASIVYMLVALLVWKVINISADLLSLTDKIVQIITLGLVILFPISMLMAWLYERSPEGFVRTGSAASLNNPFSDEQKKPLTSNTFIGLLAVTLIALFFIFPQWGNHKSLENDEVEKSIAVLPFNNLSNDPEQQFFADGVMEDILTQLQRMSELKVTSKTSVEQYRNATKSVSQIGDELNVSYLLEGSVRKSDDQIMITAQLIRASDDSHLWADNFTSTYTTTGLFDIQKQIAESIVRELRLKISPIKINEITQAQTTNKEAYEHFQKGRQLYGLYNRTSNELAIEQLQLAIQKDPNYAAAFGQLSSAFVQKRIRFEGDESLLDSAIVAANRGIELDSLCAECYKGLAFAIQIDGKIKQALTYYEKAISLNPNFSNALNNARLNYFTVGDTKNALEIVQKLRKVDPDNFILNIGTSYAALGNYKAALPYLQKAVELQNDADNLDNLMDCYYYLGDVGKFREAIRNMYVLTGDSVRVHWDWVESLWRSRAYSEAVTYYENKLMKNENLGRAAIEIADSYYKIGAQDKSRKFCQERIKDILSDNNQNPELIEENWKIYNLASFHAISNNKEEAFKWMQKAISNNYLQTSINESFFDNIREEPRFKELIKLQEKKRAEAQALMDSYHFPKAEDL